MYNDASFVYHYTFLYKGFYDGLDFVLLVFHVFSRELPPVYHHHQATLPQSPGSASLQPQIIPSRLVATSINRDFYTVCESISFLEVSSNSYSFPLLSVSVTSCRLHLFPEEGFFSAHTLYSFQNFKGFF